MADAGPVQNFHLIASGFFELLMAVEKDRRSIALGRKSFQSEAHHHKIGAEIASYSGSRCAEPLDSKCKSAVADLERYLTVAAL